MEKLNLEKYLANPSRKVVTRDGRNARIICTDMKSTTYPVVALVGNCSSDFEQIFTFSKNGEYAVSESSRSDLFFAPEKHEGWVSIHRGYINGYYTTGIFDSEEKAKERGGSIATVKVEWED